MSNKIYENLLDFVYIYPPSLLIIYSLVIIKNKCNLEDSEIIKTIKKLFSISDNSTPRNHKTQRNARKEQLKKTDDGVMIIFGAISLICYLLIRFFMDNIKEKIDLQEVQCKLKDSVTGALLNDIKETDDVQSKANINESIQNMEKICNDRGQNQSDKNGKCLSCITYNHADSYYHGLPCELKDSNDPNIKISGELNQTKTSVDENCKYYNNTITDRSDSDKINKGLYIFNNLCIFLLLMFSCGWCLLDYGFYLYYILPIIIMLGVSFLILFFGEHFDFSNDSNIYIFNGILWVIMSCIHVINMKVSKSI